MMELYPDVLMVSDIQRILRIGRTKAYHLVNSGQIPSIRIGNVIRIPKVRLLEFMNQSGYNNGEADRRRYNEGG